MAIGQKPFDEVGQKSYSKGMEQFLKEVRDYAAAIGVQPSTVVQRAAGMGGAKWSRWVAGDSSPTLRTVDKVRAYIAENPPEKNKGAAA